MTLDTKPTLIRTHGHLASSYGFKAMLDDTFNDSKAMLDVTSNDSWVNIVYKYLEIVTLDS
jgi:hypothetical protein